MNQLAHELARVTNSYRGECEWYSPYLKIDVMILINEGSYIVRKKIYLGEEIEVEVCR